MATVSLQKDFKLDEKGAKKLIKAAKKSKPYKKQTQGEIIFK